MNDLVSVDLNGLGGLELEEAYSLIEQLGSNRFVLHVDKRVYASTITPKHIYKFTDKRPPLGSIDVSGLRMELKAAEAAAALIDSGLLSEPDTVVERVHIQDVKAEVKTIEADEPQVTHFDEEEELRARAKEAGINNYWNKSVDKLESELAELAELED